MKLKFPEHIQTFYATSGKSYQRDENHETTASGSDAVEMLKAGFQMLATTAVVEEEVAEKVEVVEVPVRIDGEQKTDDSSGQGSEQKTDDSAGANVQQNDSGEQKTDGADNAAA